MAIQQQSLSNQNLNNDEIDLIELIFSVWKKKWWVILTAVLFALGAVGYALTAKEEWTSTAEVVQPDAADMGGYLDRYVQYLSIIDPKQVPNKNQYQNQSQNQNQNQNQGQETEALEKILEAIFNRFLSASGSYENHLNYYKIALPNVQDKELIRLIKSISIKKPDEKKNIQHLTLTLSNEQAVVAQNHLKNLIKYINTEVSSKALVSLNAEIQTKIRALAIEQESIKAFADTSLSVRLKNLNKALQIASKAGIKKYSVSGSGQFLIPGGSSGEVGIKLEDDRLAEDNFLFMLGTDYLQAQIDTLQESETIYPERYYQVQLQSKLLKALLSEEGDSQFETFSYQSAPSLPLQRDKPKRALIVLIGTFLGGVIGIIVALFMAALESRRAKTR